MRSEHGTAAANDTATVTITPRSTTDLTAYTTREAVPGDFENATAVRDAIADGTLTAATTAGANDTVVYGVNATGLTGLPAAVNASLDRGADLARLDGLSFGVTRTNASKATDPTEGDALGPVPNESTVHLDRTGLFLVADGETAFGTETPPADGETFEAGFRVDDERLNRTGDDPVTTRLTYAADPVDEPVTNGSANESDTPGSTEADPTGSGGPAGTGTIAGPGAGNGSDADDTSGAPVESGGSGGSGSSGASGGSSSSGVPAGGSPSAGDTGGDGSDATASNGSGQEVANGSRGPDTDRATAPPGTGITVAPGPSEIPPSAGPPALFGADGTAEDADDSSAREPHAETDRPDADRGSESGSEAAAGKTESADTTEPSDSDESAARDLGYDDAPIRSTAYDLPGFGPLGSLAAVASAALLARRRA
ncbi:Endoglucanase [Halorubrum sp. DM2]|nr:Endoglucanase [Halorubrum sp. DM2]